MKTNVTTIAIAMLSISSLFVACKKEEIRPLPNNISDKAEIAQPAERGMAADYQVSPKDMLINGKWAIPDYNGSNEFKDYIFSFNQYHVAFANSRERSVTGKWNIITNSAGETRVVIDFGMKPFLYLNNTWILRSYSTKYFSFVGNVNNQKETLNMVSAQNMPK